MKLLVWLLLATMSALASIMATAEAQVMNSTNEPPKRLLISQEDDEDNLVCVPVPIRPPLHFGKRGGAGSRNGRSVNDSVNKRPPFSSSTADCLAVVRKVDEAAYYQQLEDYQMQHYGEKVPMGNIRTEQNVHGHSLWDSITMQANNLKRALSRLLQQLTFKSSENNLAGNDENVE